MVNAVHIFLSGFLLDSALGMVPPPENVTMNSVNFKNILQWESPAFPKGNLTYTAQFLSYNNFQDKCNSTTLMECDFSSISKYGQYILRVRSEYANEHSDWVVITFSPVEDTRIGPPEVQVEVIADSLHLRFFAPKVVGEPETWTMRHMYPSWVYNVQYWKNGTEEKFEHLEKFDSFTLQNLEPHTTYCVQAQGFLNDQKKSGEWSQPVCEETSHDETLSAWIVVIILIASVLVVSLLLVSCFVLMCYIYKKIKYTFAAGNSLPQHLKEFLSSPHHSTQLFNSLPPSDENGVFDKLNVITEDLENSQQSAGHSDSLWSSSWSSSKQGFLELVSEEKAQHSGHSQHLLHSAASEDHQSPREPRPPGQTPNLEPLYTGL